MTDGSSHITRLTSGALRKIRRYVRVSLTLADGGQQTERIRAVTTVAFVALLFAGFGTVRFAMGIAGHFGDVPFEFDRALRTLSVGWFQSERTIPVTLVDIDEATNRAWGSPAITPRGDLARLLEVVSAAGPAAIVVDIDLSWGDRRTRDAGGAEDAGQRTLQDFLDQYAGRAPIVFPKRIEPAADGLPHAAASPFDDTFQRNSRLAWAHASFETDANGKVREWREWLPYCTGSGTKWLPAVPVSLAANLDPLPDGLQRPTPPTAAGGACGSADARDGVQQRRLLVGPRLSGEGRRRSARAEVVSATVLLDRDVARDDRRLFADRVVLIGATHASAGDLWLTHAGVIPGVELLANLVRFAPQVFQVPGAMARAVHRVAAIALFLAFAAIQWRYRALVALGVSTILVLAVLAVSIDVFDDFGIFDVIQASILMFVVYKALELVLKLVADVKERGAVHPPGRRRRTEMLRALYRRKRPLPPGEHDEYVH
ncbi:MAG TPA: CHASE2 domain-containing protein [Steroidobacteraceae bacterium]|nr:CHASE2 domain-containing protein [Steroidobacteraceae bacterium]